MEATWAWLSEPLHWPIITAVCYTVDKVVAATPNKHDDFVVSVVIGGLKRLFGKSPVDDSQA